MLPTRLARTALAPLPPASQVRPPTKNFAEVKCGGSCTLLVCGLACVMMAAHLLLALLPPRRLPDYADCDGDPANGCEVNTQQDAANCGGCSRLDPTRACSLPNAVAKCVSGSCAIDSCSPGALALLLLLLGCWWRCCRSSAEQKVTRMPKLPHTAGACPGVWSAGPLTRPLPAATCRSSGWADCDDDAANGCETQLNTVANCGGCSNLDSKFACSSANGTPTCTGGQCTIACASGAPSLLMMLAAAYKHSMLGFWRVRGSRYAPAGICCMDPAAWRCRDPLECASSAAQQCCNAMLPMNRLRLTCVHSSPPPRLCRLRWRPCHRL